MELAGLAVLTIAVDLSTLFAELDADRGGTFTKQYFRHGLIISVVARNQVPFAQA